MMRKAIYLLAALGAACIGDPTPFGPSVVDQGMPTADAGTDDGSERIDAQEPVDATDERDAGMDTGEPSGDLSFVDIAIADRVACALENTGRTLCWGANDSRLLGEPAQVPDGAHMAPFWRGRGFEFDSLDAGARHFCGIRMGAVYCWGDNASGASDPGAPGAAFAEPRRVAFAGVSAARALDVSAGADVSCAVFEDGKVACWGLNRFGLVDASGGADMPLAPTLIPVGSAKTVHVGANHACAVLDRGELYCWGDNAQEQAIPGAGAGPLPPTRHGSVLFGAVDAGAFTCGATGERVRCWGENIEARLGTDANVSLVASVQNVVEPGQIAVGADHACALSLDGGVSCWGAWRDAPPELPREFPSGDGRGFRVVAAGVRVSCAAHLRALACWGTNGTDGLVGQFDTDGPVPGDFSEPTMVPVP